jgi:hypothetical protein
VVKIYFVAFLFMTLCRLTTAVSWLTLLLCNHIQQLFGSHSVPDTSYPAVIFYGFSQYLQTSAVLVPQIKLNQMCFQLIICYFIIRCIKDIDGGYWLFIWWLQYDASQKWF